MAPCPTAGMQQTLVLGKFTKTEQKLLENELIRICDAVDAWVTQGMTAAMNGFNG